MGFLTPSIQGFDIWGKKQQQIKYKHKNKKKSPNPHPLKVL